MLGSVSRLARSGDCLCFGTELLPSTPGKVSWLCAANPARRAGSLFLDLVDKHAHTHTHTYAQPHTCTTYTQRQTHTETHRHTHAQAHAHTRTRTRTISGVCHNNTEGAGANGIDGEHCAGKIDGQTSRCTQAVPRVYMAVFRVHSIHNPCSTVNSCACLSYGEQVAHVRSPRAFCGRILPRGFRVHVPHCLFLWPAPVVATAAAPPHFPSDPAALLCSVCSMCGVVAPSCLLFALPLHLLRHGLRDIPAPCTLAPLDAGEHFFVE